MTALSDRGAIERMDQCPELCARDSGWRSGLLFGLEAGRGSVVSDCGVLGDSMAELT
jgi:hypothetical protein